ncbi:MAG: prepilin-type N-terminal cleavage/methylation domain-containing protein, partial [Coleofasciculaceae cyanobacterium]
MQNSIAAKSSGFTIIECLLAIIIVSVMLTAVAPVIVLSVATRVQARRVEQATMAGRNYIDAVRGGTIPAPASLITLNEVDATGAFTPDRSSFAAAPPPPAETTLSCSGDPTDPVYPYCTNDASLSLYCVDNGGGCVGA